MVLYLFTPAGDNIVKEVECVSGFRGNKVKIKLMPKALFWEW
jgi:hypothetical protein